MPTNDSWWMPSEDENYCAHCLSEVERDALRCFRCDAPFTGEGRFDLVSGNPPAVTEIWESAVGR